MMAVPRRIVAAVCVSLLVASPVLAQRPTPTPQQKQAAGELTKQAIAKSQAGEHAKAIALYLRAFEIVPLPVLLSNVAAEYQKLAKRAEALKYFCMYLEKDPGGQLASFATAQAKAIQIEQGNEDVTDATVCMEPSPAAKPTTEPAQPTRTLTDRGGALRLTGLAVGAVGLVGLGVGAYYGVKAKDISDDITNHPTTEMWPEGIQELEDEGQAHENKQIIFMIAGGALVATGVTLYIIGRMRKGTREQVSVVPTATPDSVGLGVVGAF
ncbi:MAG TPA: tetratricopeptide repeat protein [Kofleriaceae bacterium]|nr:tetratricopeptide repeat protein [Kofleriaceae bacterium]